MASWRWRAAGIVVLAFGVQAAPVDDAYQRALQAYQRGDVVGAMNGLKPGAGAGHAPSQSLLAFILDRADFPEQSATLYASAAAQGDAEAHAGLANLLLTGRGIAKDEKAAFEHFSKAAQLGHELAIQVVAEGWLKGQFGLDAAREPALAKAAWERAAGRGHLGSAEALQSACARAADAACEAQWRARVAEIKRQKLGAGGAKGRS